MNLSSAESTAAQTFVGGFGSIKPLSLFSGADSMIGDSILEEGSVIDGKESISHMKSVLEDTQNQFPPKFDLYGGVKSKYLKIAQGTYSNISPRSHSTVKKNIDSIKNLS